MATGSFFSMATIKKMPKQVFLMSETRKIKKQGEVQDLCTVFYIDLIYRPKLGFTHKVIYSYVNNLMYHIKKNI